MDSYQRLHLAKLAYAQRNNARRYLVSWRGGGEVTEYKGEVGIAELAKQLRITVHSLKCYLSKGKGQHIFKGHNPTLGIDDIGTITRCDPPVKEKRPRGRPRKAINWERMGSEAPDNPSGTVLAHTAKTVPKTRNRRTDESQ